jgi:chemotaxis protein CheD
VFSNQVVTIGPGELYVTREKKVIKTLLGSCVAACLYDESNQVIGMNHFLLVKDKAQASVDIMHTRVGYYGIHAMELLINAMMKQGANRRHLKAKLFGGGNVLRKAKDIDFFNIGKMNSQFVLDFMARERIPVVAQDLENNYGRVIFFDAQDFSVSMKRIVPEQAKRIVKEETDYAVERLNSTASQTQSDIFL